MNPTTQTILIVAAVIVMIGLALLLAAVILWMFWRWIAKFVNTMAAFIAAIEKFTNVAEEIRQGNRAIEGHVKTAERFVLELAKMRLTVDKFATLINRPDVEMENAKTGYMAPTDSDANKQFTVQSFMQEGYSKEEAEAMAQNALGI